MIQAKLTIKLFLLSYIIQTTPDKSKERNTRCSEYYRKKASAYSAYSLSNVRERLKRYTDKQLPDAPENISEIQTAIDQARQAIKEAKRMIAENENDREPD